MVLIKLLHNREQTMEVS